MELINCSPNKSCIRKPVMKMEAANCPPDLLHMKKGIITKLVNQLVDWTMAQSNEKKLLDQMKKNKIPFT